ncbi:hypothetical protein QSJ19_01530 [Gordonia sp. ABSL11-1]|uniref:hypothetical protein n=1 Tax=Gordonia sp. ABSL11-1 TaxID=3053924 RepID=UPI0025746710|nr:hypothetical protein [Gordonia sp. ABSL11-1]MDL9944284.1 hypothetical protein [Gordonia sp. ABSL11-1]
MNLVDLHAEVQGYRDTAGQLADDYTRAHAEISSNPALTNDGKREQLEPLHQETADKMHELHQREKTAVKTYKEKLERNLYGLSPSASTNPDQLRLYREAQTLTRDLADSEDAAVVYESAKRSGDTILAAAVLEKALVRGWTNIKNDYIERHPDTRNALDDLGALAKFTDNRLANTAQYMPPSADLPRPSAGFPQLGDLTAASTPKRPRDLGDVMAERVTADGTRRYF